MGLALGLRLHHYHHIGLSILSRFAPELIDHITAFCTPDTLASLARTHSSLHNHSERSLYQQVFIYALCDIVRFLETISTHLGKASRVESLVIESPQTVWNADTSELVTLLCRALGGMERISDLRLRLSEGEEPRQSGVSSVETAKCRKKLSDTLGREANNMKLRTLYCSSELDYAKIIKNHPTLQILGLYVKHPHRTGFVCRLREICLSAKSAIPTVFDMERGKFHHDPWALDDPPLQPADTLQVHEFSIFPTLFPQASLTMGQRAVS